MYKPMLYTTPFRGHGGIGRHKRLKISRGQPCAGSSPAARTTFLQQITNTAPHLLTIFPNTAFFCFVIIPLCYKAIIFYKSP